MTPSFMNSSPNSPFHIETHKDHDHHHQFFAPNQQVSSSSSYSYQFYYSSAQDQIGYYPPQPLEGENGGGSFEVETGLKLTLGNKVSEAGNGNPMKWMTSKMKKSSSIQSKKLPSSSSLDIDYSSNSSSNNIITSIRVCSDCNTTKTPLWRSGPKGPKSLCNACGIRQRKARRAMAAAAAAAADGTTFACETPKVKIKVNNNKEKIKKNIIAQSTVPFKKRCCKGINIINNSGIEKTTTTITTTSISSQEPKTKKLGFEDFLINLSNKLAFHHVFPQDDKEAAILLMALSCDLIHS